MVLDEISLVVASTVEDAVVLVPTTIELPLLGITLVVIEAVVVLVNGATVVKSDPPLLNIDTAVPKTSTSFGSKISTRSLAENTLTLPGLTSKFASVGNVEVTNCALSVVVSGVEVVETIELVGSVVAITVAL